MLDLLRNITYNFFPGICICCNLPSNNKELDLCKHCAKYLPWHENGCYQCGAELIHGYDSILCQQCQENPPSFMRLCVLFYYQMPIIKLINRLKYGPNLYPAIFFGKLLAEALKNRWYLNQSLPEVIIPVPLHPKRQAKRGYNQAQELCVPIAKMLKIPIDMHVCKRVANTKPQSSLKRKARVIGLQNAFQVNNISCYQHVAVVDDVVTTGSTIRAITKVLLDSGVKQVDVWCVCRA